MGIVTETTYSYECDQCEKAVTPAQQAGPGLPENWRRVDPASADGDLFCSWTCLAAFAAAQAEVPR